MENESSIGNLGKSVSRQKEISQRMKILSENLKDADKKEREIILSEIGVLKNFLSKINKQSAKSTKRISMYKPLNPSKLNQATPSKIKLEIQKTGKSLPTVNASFSIKPMSKKELKKEFKLSKIEMETIKRMKKKDKESLKYLKEKQKIRSPSKYVKMSSKLFRNLSNDLLKKGKFKNLANLFYYCTHL